LHRHRSPTTRGDLGERIGTRLADSANAMIRPSGVMRPIAPWAGSVNQRLPSGPATILEGSDRGSGNSNSVRAPAGVNRAIVRRPTAVIQMFPSGPEASSVGPRKGNTVFVSGSGVTRTISLYPLSPNQRFPSGPEMMESGAETP